jgi:hypothetical protein
MVAGRVAAGICSSSAARGFLHVHQNSNIWPITKRAQRCYLKNPRMSAALASSPKPDATELNPPPTHCAAAAKYTPSTHTHVEHSTIKE